MESTLREYKYPRESYCGLPPQWRCTVNGTAVAAVLIDQSRSFQPRWPTAAVTAAQPARLKSSSVWHLPVLFDQALTHRSPHVTSTSLHRSQWNTNLVFPFHSRNLRIKFGANPSTFFLVIVVTDRYTDTHTHKPTPVKTYSLAFAGIINVDKRKDDKMCKKRNLEQTWNQRRQQWTHDVFVFGRLNHFDLHLDSGQVQWELVSLDERVQNVDTLLGRNGTR